MIWICEALQVGFEAHPWCNHIRKFGPYPKIPENLPSTQGGIMLRLVPYTHSQLIKVQKHFKYIWYGFVKHFKSGLRLIHDVTTSDRSVPTPKFLKIYP
jgi:hypothetical protein